MRASNNGLTSLQRRSISLVGSSLGVCAALSLSLHEIPLHHFTAATYGIIALIGAAPILMTVLVIGRYLAKETDEYLRSVVVQSVLWGSGLILILDTVLGYLVAFASVDPIHLRSLGVFNLEIFIVTAAVALRVQLWRNR
jgi:small-conductance mechanosensitive channel